MKAIYYSNLADVLAEKLKDNIFFNYSSKEVYVFIPNKNLKNEILKKIADDKNINVVFDIKFVPFSNFLNFFQKILKHPNEKRFLSFFKLLTIIREKILKKIQKLDIRYEFLKKYLSKDDKSSKKRLSHICNNIAEEFMKYLSFGNFEDLKSKLETSWQADLFYEIFYIDKFPNVFSDLKNLDISSLQKNTSFHFFDIKYMPPIYFDFLNNFKEVHHYITSPTSAFWEDILSDFERDKLSKFHKKSNKNEAKLEELTELLKDRNCFLANFEKVKRKYLNTINAYDDYETYDFYFLSKEFSQYEDKLKDSELLENAIQESSCSSSKLYQGNLLYNFKKDILFLTNTKERKAITIQDDNSISIDVSTSILNEMHALYNNILKLLSDSSYEPSDIYVLSLDIDKYQKFVPLIFDNEENPISYKILGRSLKPDSFLIKGILKLFKIATSNWEKEDILELFQNPLFQKKFNFSYDEISFLFESIEKANIESFLDKDHILKKNVKKEHLPSLYNRSWEKGFLRIISGFFFQLKSNVLNKNFIFDFPVYFLDMKLSSIIEKFLNVFSLLRKDLRVIEENKKLKILDWKNYLKKILNNYFEIDGNYIENVANSFFQDFLKELESNISDETYEFDFIFSYLEKSLESKKDNFNSNDMNAITFSSLDISKISAKAVFIIGLNFDFNFDFKNSSNITFGIDIPSISDINRSNILASMLLPEEKLFLSYHGVDDYKISSSIIMQEILSYLDSSYKIEDKMPSEIIIKKHPSFLFHEKYFSKENTLTNYSKNNFLAAKTFYKTEENEEKINDKNINFEFQTNQKELSPKDLNDKNILDIKDLKSFCKNPIKFYINKGLNIFLDEQREKNDFSISSLDKYIVRNLSFAHETEDILFTLENIAKMPYEIFSNIEKEKIIDDIFKLQNFLKSLDVDYKNIKTLNFSIDTKEIKKIDNNNYILPALDIEVFNEGYKIIGKLENISNKGILFHVDDNLAGNMKVWIDLLIFLAVSNDLFEKKINIFDNNVIYTKNKKVKNSDFDPKKYLKNFIRHYLNHLKDPCFLTPIFTKHIFKKDEIALEKEIKNVKMSKNDFLDIYQKWYFENFDLPKPLKIIDKFSKDIKNLYGPILEIK